MKINLQALDKKSSGMVSSMKKISILLIGLLCLTIATGSVCALPYSDESIYEYENYDDIPRQYITPENFTYLSEKFGITEIPATIWIICDINGAKVMYTGYGNDTCEHKTQYIKNSETEIEIDISKINKAVINVSSDEHESQTIVLEPPYFPLYLNDKYHYIVDLKRTVFHDLPIEEYELYDDIPRQYLTLENYSVLQEKFGISALSGEINVHCNVENATVTVVQLGSWNKKSNQTQSITHTQTITNGTTQIYYNIIWVEKMTLNVSADGYESQMINVTDKPKYAGDCVRFNVTLNPLSVKSPLPITGMICVLILCSVVFLYRRGQERK